MRPFAITGILLVVAAASCSKSPTGSAARAQACSLIDRVNKVEYSVFLDRSKAPDAAPELKRLFRDAVASAKRSNDEDLRNTAEGMERAGAAGNVEEGLRLQKEMSRLCGVPFPLSSPTTTSSP